MFRTLKPPTPLDSVTHARSVFLAGSIEMGLAGNWQDQFTDAIQDLDVLVLNPRRDEWDASWEQSINNRMFREQVDWELDAQQKATWIVMYFAPDTKAPITLLELGLFAASGKLIVCCPDGFWRKGNVEIVCARQRIPLLETLDELIAALRERLE